jgi:hypothetical protein
VAFLSRPDNQLKEIKLSAVQQFRKKPVVIEAMEWDLTDPLKTGGVVGWLLGHGCDFYHRDSSTLAIRTLEGEMWASPGDWIIRGVKGEFYPCKPDIFAAIYEPAEAE